MALPSWPLEVPSLVFEAEDRPLSLLALAWVPLGREGTAQFDGSPRRGCSAQL